MRRSLLNDITSTATTSVFVATSMILMTSWLAAGLGPEEFGGYSTARRLALFLLPFLTMAVNIGLTREIARTPNDAIRIASLFVAGVSVTLPIMAFLLVLMFFGTEFLSELVFAQSGHPHLLLASTLFLFGNALHMVYVSYLRGVGRILEANLWNVWGAASQLVLAWSSAVYTVEWQLAGSGMLLLLAVCPIGLTIGRLSPITISSWREALHTLLSYGWLRGPSAIVLDGLATASYFLLLHLDSMTSAGHLALAYTLLRCADLAIGPLGVAMLSRTETMMKAMHTDQWKQTLQHTQDALIDIPPFVAGQLMAWMPLLIMLWVGPQYENAVTTIQVVTMSFAPYTWFLLGRNVLDSIDTFPWTTRYLSMAAIIGMLTGVTLAFALPFVWAIIIASTTTFTVLGLLLLRHLNLRFELKPIHHHLIRSVFINSLFALLSTVICKAISSLTLPGQAMVAILVLTIFTGVYVRWCIQKPCYWQQIVRASLTTWKPVGTLS